MSYGKEYMGSTVGSRSCSYQTLAGNCGNNTMAALAPGTTSGTFIVPSYGAIGYDTLNHGRKVPGCGTYFNIMDAYGAGAANCQTSYTTRLCGGGNCGGGGSGTAYKCVSGSCQQAHPGTQGAMKLADCQKYCSE